MFACEIVFVRTPLQPTINDAGKIPRPPLEHSAAPGATIFRHAGAGYALGKTSWAILHTAKRHGGRVESVAHDSEQNGDPMRDPEIVFEVAAGK